MISNCLRKTPCWLPSPAVQATSDDQPLYAPVTAFASLKKTLEDKLAEYNETNAVMDLVLFQQAIEHVTRIARIIDLPR
jgi:dynein heavy chain